MTKLLLHVLVVLAALVALFLSYVYFGTPSESAFSRIRRGDSEATVLAILGRPQDVEREAPYVTAADIEYQYYVFPVPTIWCVAFKDGVVLEAVVLQSP
jgi:hypothetical protein